MIITVNAEHTYEWQSENGQYWKKCKFCDDETAKKDIPTITINGADVVCITQNYKFSITLPEGATDALYGYDFEYMGASGLEPVTEDGKLYGAVSAGDYDLGAKSFKVTVAAKTADGFDISASKVVSLKSEHTDAEPKDHICDICGATLSEHTAENDTDSPQTGDNSLMALWMALLFVSGGAVIGTTLVSKKKKHSENKNQ